MNNNGPICIKIANRISGWRKIKSAVRSFFGLQRERMLVFSPMLLAKEIWTRNLAVVKRQVYVSCQNENEPIFLLCQRLMTSPIMVGLITITFVDIKKPGYADKLFVSFVSRDCNDRTHITLQAEPIGNSNSCRFFCDIPMDANTQLHIPFINKSFVATMFLYERKDINPARSLANTEK